MPSVFLNQATIDYLKEASGGQSMDATVRRLLNLDKSKSGSLVKRQVPRQNLAPIGAYTWTILSRFKQLENQHPELLRKDLQAQVHEYLSDGGLFEVYPDDNAATNTVERGTIATYTDPGATSDVPPDYTVTASPSQGQPTYVNPNVVGNFRDIVVFCLEIRPHTVRHKSL